MSVFKIMTLFSDSGEMSKCDGIEYQGKIWLVPHWLNYPATQERKPVRIVHLGAQGLKPSTFAGCQYITEAMLLSKAVLEGRAQPIPPIEVVESPDIAFPIPKQLH